MVVRMFSAWALAMTSPSFYLQRVGTALHQAFVETQSTMPAELPDCNAGTTAVVCWLEHGLVCGGGAVCIGVERLLLLLVFAEHCADIRNQAPSDGGVKVYAACLGDSQAFIFEQYTGAIQQRDCRIWDHEMGTIQSKGEDAVLPFETTAHGITGGIVRSKSGKPVGMQNDPTGVGFREYELLRRRNRIPSSKDPKCLSNMPGEERWRLLDLEPTRALGHVGKKHVPLHCPEIYEWPVPETQNYMMLMCCDGFFSKSAFTSPEMVAKFLVDPVGFCHRPGVCCVLLSACVYIQVYVCISMHASACR